MKLSDYIYELPEERIALHPPKQRGSSRMLVLNKYTGNIAHSKYSEFYEYIQPGDVVVLNDTKVIKARLIALNSTQKTRELLLLEDHHNTDFMRRKVLYKGRIRTGEILIVKDTPVTVEAVLDNGIAEISSTVNLLHLAETSGSVPLPPYMHREATQEDTERYQTVFAKEPGSVAAPTASLNFTQLLQEQIVAKGGKIVYLTLHVGLGTFLPIRTDDVQNHKMHSEYFEVPASTIKTIREAKKRNNRIFAVGTTVTRTLEYIAQQHPQYLSGPNSIASISGEADIFIYPGYEFKVFDALLTNFHAPKSTVLMLAASFSGWEHLKLAYTEAIHEKYAFLSYGDSMLII